MTAAALRGGRVSVVQVATDAFGNALGQSLAAGNGQAAGSGTGDFARMDGASYRSAPYDAPQTGGMTTLFDGSTISDAENLRRIASARESGALYAANGIEDPTQQQVMTDAGEGWRRREDGWLEKSSTESDGTTTVRAKRDTGFDPQAVDRQVRDGSFNAFYAIGGAIAEGRLGDAWKYATYTPSQQARDAAYARVFPGQAGGTTALSDQARMNSSGFQLGQNLATGFIGVALASPPGLAASNLVAGFGLGTNLQRENYAGAAGNALEMGANFLAAGAVSGMMAGIRAEGRVDSPVKAAFGSAGNALPDGLAYRLDLPEHLAGPGGFTKSGQLAGTHNLEHATAALDAKGATYTLTPTRTDGISELFYSYAKPTSGKIIVGSKTVYDPSVFSDKTMLDYSQNAGREGWTRYLADPSTTSFDITHGGVKFRTYINVDQYGNPYVGNVHPIK